MNVLARTVERVRSFPPLAIVILLFAATVLLFAPARNFDFQPVDDIDYATDHSIVKEGMTVEGVVLVFTTFQFSNYHPITWLSHMTDISLFGKSPTGPHVVNVLLHAVNAALAFLVFNAMTRRAGPSFALALLFALHPLRVESVAWVAGRKDLLSGLFFLLALRTHQKVVARENGLRGHLAVAGWFLLALLSKPIVVTLPFVLLLLDIWPFRRLDIGSMRGFATTAPPLVKEKILLFLMAGASSVVTFMAQHSGGSTGFGRTLPAADRIVNAVVSYAIYLGKTFWPNPLATFYPHPRSSLGLPVVAAALLLIAVVTFAAFRLRKTAPSILVGWLWFVGMLVPVIGLVQVGMQAYADRYTYLPHLGLCAAISYGTADLFRRSTLSRTGGGALVAMGAAALLLLSVTTSKYLEKWQDGETLHRHAIAVTDNNAFAHYNLWFSLVETGRVEEAEEHFRRSLAIAFKTADTHIDDGIAWVKYGRLAQAERHFREAIGIEPWNANAWFNYGALLQTREKYAEAAGYYRKALSLQADFAPAQRELDRLKPILPVSTTAVATGPPGAP